MRAAALASGHALLVLVQDVPRLASAHARRHALATPVAAVRADRPAHVADLVVAQLAHAHVRRVAVGVLLATVLAYRHAYAVLGSPSRLAAADVRTRATAAEAAAVALRLAKAVRHVAPVAVAAVQDGDPLVVLTNRIFAPSRIVVYLNRLI